MLEMKPKIKKPVIIKCFTLFGFILIAYNYISTTKHSLLSILQTQRKQI